MYSVWLTDDEQRVWRDYLTMTARLQAEMNRQLQADCGLSLADYDVLVALDERGRVPDQRTRRSAGLGAEQAVTSTEADADPWPGRPAPAPTTTAAGPPSTSPTADARRLTAAAPGHAELVRAVVFDGVPATELRALGRWTARVLDRLA